MILLNGLLLNFQLSWEPFGGINICPFMKIKIPAVEPNLFFYQICGDLLLQIIYIHILVMCILRVL